MPIRLVARRAFVFQRLAGGGCLTCAAGDRFEVTPIEAVLLRARGVVDFAPATPPAPSPEPEKPRRRYRRRDLVAEGTEK